jgi:CubicO group peptidase (beta-lactamase class C family)
MSSEHLRRLIMAIIFATAFPGMALPQTNSKTVLSQGTAAKGQLTDAADMQKRLGAIEQSVEAMRKKLGIPGLSLVIVKDDQVIYLKGFGLRDVERGLPVTSDTLFGIGSATKSFTAMLTMISVDQGKVSLNDSPRRFLPYFRLRDPSANAKVTIRDLLCHRTGLMGYSDLGLATGVLNRQELIQTAGFAKPTAGFREKFQYNNVMFATAGEAVAGAYQTTWEQLIEALVFKPLGMKQTNTSIAQMQQSPDFSQRYALVDATGKNQALPMRDISAIGPAGSINSNVTDLAQWLRLMLGGGVFNGKRIVSQESFAELWSPQINVSEHVDYGLGWGLADWKGLRLALHNGGSDGFHSLIEMARNKNIGFALLANVEEPSLDAAARHIIWSNLLDIKLEDPSPAATGADASKKEVNLDELVATYKNPDDPSVAEIKINDGKAVLLMTGEPTYTLVPKGNDEFGVVELPASYSLRVKRDASGKVASIILVEPEGTTEVKRMNKTAKPLVPRMPVKTLIQHMIVAAGGEANLRKHSTMQASIAIDFENQGVTGYGSISSRAPNSQSTEMTLTALGKAIGTTREYFDGREGGEESSFVSAEAWDADSLENKKIESDFYNQLLNWAGLFKSVKIAKMSKIGPERVYVVEKIAANGTSVVDYVSAKSFNLLRRETIEAPGSDTITESFSDFRIVDNVRVPFRTLQHTEEFGDITIQIKKLRFNVDFADEVFRAQPNRKSSQLR